MKNLKQILIVIFVLTLIASCDKDENELKETLEKATISAKWIVGNSSEYESFEFNESGNYIVVENTTTKSTIDQIILFGTYKIINNRTIVLSGFGTLTISKINENSISFSIQLASNPDNEIVINASKQEEMESSNNTDLLCRTWELISINEEDVAGTENETTVLFSKAGTYLVAYSDGGSGIAQWKWKDEAETQFFYSWEEIPVWDEDHYVEIIELTNSTLKIHEEFGESLLYVLEPIVNTKSAKINPGVEITRKTGIKGLFKK